MEVKLEKGATSPSTVVFENEASAAKRARKRRKEKVGGLLRSLSLLSPLSNGNRQCCIKAGPFLFLILLLLLANLCSTLPRSCFCLWTWQTTMTLQHSDLEGDFADDGCCKFFDILFLFSSVKLYCFFSLLSFVAGVYSKDVSFYNLY